MVSLEAPPIKDGDSDELFRLALEAAPTGMLLVDEQGTIVLVNVQLERLFGYSRDELVGKPVEILLPERFRRAHQDERRRYSRNTTTRLMGAGRDLFGLRRDGTEVPIEIGLNPLETRDGRFVLSSVSDITARKRVEQERESLARQLAHAEAAEKFKSVFEHSPIAMALLDRNLRYAHINGAWTRILGYQLRDLAGKNPADITHPEDRPEDARLVAALVRGEISSYSREKRYVHRDGRIVHVLIHAAAASDPGVEGPLYIGQLQDITDRIRAEEAVRTLKGERKAQERALAKERERFRTLVTSAPVGIFEMDGAGNVLYMNDQWCALTGLSHEEAKLPELRIAGVHPDDRERLLRTWAEARATGTGYRVDFRYDTSSGESKRLSSVAAPLRGQDGVVTGFIGITLDATAQLNAADAVERSLREKETLLKEIHHRVKNNLQVIGSIIGLQANRSDDPGVHRVFDDVRGRIHAIARLHEQLYRSTDLGAIDLGEYLRDLALDAARSAGAPSERITVRSPSSPIFLGIDDAVPVGLITNELVSNAVKHGSRGVEKAKVELELSLEGDAVRVTVADDGPGFPEAVQPETRASLGMSLVEALTRQLRGRITFASRPSRGTLTFPLSKHGGDA